MILKGNSPKRKLGVRLLAVTLTLALVLADSFVVSAADDNIPQIQFDDDTTQMQSGNGIPQIEIEAADEQDVKTVEVPDTNADKTATVQTIPAENFDTTSDNCILTLSEGATDSTYAFNLAIPANSTVQSTTGYYLRAGDTVEISASWAETSSAVRIGVTSATTFYCVTGSGGSISTSFEVAEAGTYYLRIDNLSDVTIHISGYFSL
jgi:hypothetical protein